MLCTCGYLFGYAARRRQRVLQLDCAPLLAKMIGHQVACDRMQPGQERPPAILVLADRLPCPEENAAGQVLSIFLRAASVHPAIAIDGRDVATVQDGER